MSRTILPKIKDVLNRFKWYFIVTFFIIAVLATLVFIREDESTYKDMAKWMIKKRGDVLDRRLKYFEESDTKSAEEIVEIEEKIKDVKETYKEIDKNVEGRSISELSKAFKRLGY